MTLLWKVKEAASGIANLAPPHSSTNSLINTHTYHFYSLGLSFPVNLGPWCLLSLSPWKRIHKIRNASVALGPNSETHRDHLDVRWNWNENGSSRCGFPRWNLEGALAYMERDQSEWKSKKVPAWGRAGLGCLSYKDLFLTLYRSWDIKEFRWLWT